MPYSSGTFTRPSNSFSNPVSGTAISPTDADTTFDAYDAALSVATQNAANGTESAPGIAFGADADNGFYRIGANNIGFSIGGAKVWDIGTTFQSSLAITPLASDGAALGSTTKMWSDLFLASGAVINLNNGDVTITHAANTLSFAGASSGYLFDADITGTGVGGPLVASQAQMEATSATTVVVTPGRVQYHPGVCKAWVNYTEITNTTNQASYGVSSLTDNGTGDTTINFATAMSGTAYGVVAFCGDPSVALGFVLGITGGKATGSYRVGTYNSGATLTDYPEVNVGIFGDQ